MFQKDMWPFAWEHPPKVSSCREWLCWALRLLGPFVNFSGLHLNATCIDHVTHLRSLTRELFDRTISEVEVEVADLCFFSSFVWLFVYVFESFDYIKVLHPWAWVWCRGFLLANAAAMMVMELESRFPPSDVMDAQSIVYPQFWLELGHEDKLTGYMNILKQTHGHTKNISSAPHVMIHVQQCWVV